MKRSTSFSSGSGVKARSWGMLFIPLIFTLAHGPFTMGADDQISKALRRTTRESGQRIALVIGNSDYVEAPLRNPVHDANGMAAVLRELGFSVTTKLNVNQQQFEDAVREFGSSVRPGDTSLFYFSGHGVQVDGVNYLVPIGADIQREYEIKYKAVNPQLILEELQHARSSFNVVILDACRNNPFRRVRSLRRGLATMSAPLDAEAQGGTLIAYATAPDNVAQDGSGNNSPYALSLMKTMNVPGLEIEQVFRQVRVAVMAETRNQQVPWEYSSVTRPFYFKPSVAPQPVLDLPPLPKPVATLALTTSPPGAKVQIGGRDAGLSGENGLLVVKEADVGRSLDILVQKDNFKESRLSLTIPSSYEGRVYTYGEIRLEPAQDERFVAFRSAFPEFGKPEFDLAKDAL